MYIGIEIREDDLFNVSTVVFLNKGVKPSKFQKWLDSMERKIFRGRCGEDNSFSVQEFATMEELEEDPTHAMDPIVDLYALPKVRGSAEKLGEILNAVFPTYGDDSLERGERGMSEAEIAAAPRKRARFPV
jgi:hypothetical protein